jgi:hypothetical protein
MAKVTNEQRLLDQLDERDEQLEELRGKLQEAGATCAAEERS